MTTPTTDAAAAAAGVEQHYLQLLAQGSWRVPHCQACARIVFYPRQICPHCGGDAFDWRAPGGSGVVYAITVVRRAAASGGDYNVCLIDLDDGFRMMSCIEDVAPDAPRIGDRVRAVVRSHGDGHRVVFLQDDAS